MNALDEANKLLRHQRAELGRAGVFRGLGVSLQVALAVVAAISVFFDDGATLASLAVIGGLLLVVWLAADRAYRTHRAAGDQARRLIQIRYGLSETIAELGLTCGSFAADTAKYENSSIETYFSTRAPPGAERLVQMVDESAFFTQALQKRSALIMALVLSVAVIAAVLGWTLFGAKLNTDAQTAAFRVVMALAVFLLSSGAIAGTLGHGQAAQTMHAVRLRLLGAQGRGYPMGDVLQVMADYNAAVEGGPLPLPIIYRLMRKKLGVRWNEYRVTVGIGA